MYFEIENTPEQVRKARRKEHVRKEAPKEETPRLVLAPFARPPQVVFENVVIGSTCERKLEIFNPSKQVQQITLSHTLPPGLKINLPEEWLVLDSESCYCLTMSWTPMQPTALRESIHFTNENRGRYDVIVVLKSSVNVKGKKQPKGFKTSPGKVKRKSSKRSPVAMYKKKAEIVFNTTREQKSFNVVQSKQHNVLKPSNIDNMDYSLDNVQPKCPFDSPTSFDLNFDTSEVFAIKLPNTNDQSYNSINQFATPMTATNVQKPINTQCNDSASDIFDKLTFTPLKALNKKTDKLDKGPKIVISMHSDSEFEDSLDEKMSNKENEIHSIVTSQQNIDLRINYQNYTQLDSEVVEPPSLQKKIPNTSSPKEQSCANFSINTDFSRISELSFVPQRFSTERKMLPKYEATDIFGDLNLNSDTYTKDSPNTSMNILGNNPSNYFAKQQSKLCKQALFKESQQYREIDERCYLRSIENSVYPYNQRPDVKSPPRSITPPLQSIPEESTQFSDTQILDRTEKKTATFTINRTFDKVPDRNSISSSRRQTWSKKDVRAEPELWKVPYSITKKSLKTRSSCSTKDSLGGKISTALEGNRTISQNNTLNQIGDVYSQSTTVDPFSSATYFYDEEAVKKFEKEFMRWLNYILTPPADLDSNVEQKIDVGKAWLENRNKEIPAAPTKEQVSSAYHSSNRLASLRRMAKALLMSPEIALVTQKLNAQIEKKLIAIRTDRNLHLDVGLQKAIMELLLCYNPLWLRIGLEAIYGTVLPLKSNSDIEGLTTFIIQRMFKNPHLKNKHSKSSAPNMLLPAYIEATKKFTLKKFFLLVFFLDQAKEKKLIPHDPCLFCRNAVCKESREIIIRFTRELIAGIGDITKHLRPLGYVVSHKQSCLDEYKYAVHNIALDIRDGVRLTKVMEIILMKNGLLNQLRTPPISRLQKIHNVQVAFNALKEANFVIAGDITAQDIADGHREKTLSLLWQLIHVFRAPLFEKAANVIQTWWRKKYEIIAEKRKQEELLRQKLNQAASVIQCWWRRIQYNRLVEWQMKQIVLAVTTIQKYCRMWLCRTRLRKWKKSVLKIEDWYKSTKMIKEAKEKLVALRAQRELQRQKSAVLIQSYIRRWLCMKQYKMTIQKIVLIQSVIRCVAMRKRYLKLRKIVTYIQEKYRAKLLMRVELQRFVEKKRSAIVVQSYYRMVKQRKLFIKLKQSVNLIEEKYVAILKMREQREKYLKLKRYAIVLQARFRGRRCRREYVRQKGLIVNLQNKIKAHLLMKKQRANFLLLKKSTIVLQNHFRAHLLMKQQRKHYILQRNSAITIQRRFHANKVARAKRNYFLKLRKSAIIIQNRFRSLLIMRKERNSFIKLKTAALVLQRKFRAWKIMKLQKGIYLRLRAATIVIQNRYRAQIKMRNERLKYLKQKSACITIQRAFRAYLSGKRERLRFIEKKEAAVVIQKWFRRCRTAKQIIHQFQRTKQACISIQRVYRAVVIGRKQRQEFLKIRTATVRIQNYYRSYIEMKTLSNQYIQLKAATVTIQRYYRGHLETKKQRKEYLELVSAATKIQNYYRLYRRCKLIRKAFCDLRNSAIKVQRRYRSLCAMRTQRSQYLALRHAVVTLQLRFRALLTMREQRQHYLEMRCAAIKIQTRFRAQYLMKRERTRYTVLLQATVKIQRFYRANILGKKQRETYLTWKKSALIIQHKYRALLAMRRERTAFLTLRKAAVAIQRRFRAQRLMLEEHSKYQNTLKAALTIQRAYRAYRAGKQQRTRFMKIKSAVVFIQRWFRYKEETRKIRSEYQQLRKAVLITQRRFRAIKERDRCRTEYLSLKKSVLLVQATYRMNIERRKFNRMKNAAITIQTHYRSYRLCKWETRREAAAICIQKYFRRYCAQSLYKRYVAKVVYIQKMWRSKLVTRLHRCEFMQKRTIVIRLQAVIRGYLVRKYLQHKKEEIKKLKEEQRLHRAACIIQAYYRGYKIRSVEANERVADLRRRWREGALKSTQASMKERNEEVLEVLRYQYDIETVIRAFRSLEFLTELFPNMYNHNAPSIVRRVYVYMSATNRSVSSIEILESAAAVLVNLTRYKVTGPKIYSRENISPILKYMLRFSNTKTYMFRIMCTYVWLFSKYDGIREDLTEYLRAPENHKVILTIKENVEKMKRMESNSRNKIFHTPQVSKFVSHTRKKDMNMSMCSNMGSSHNKGEKLILPALEPDYGITRSDKPKYFLDPYQGIKVIIKTFYD